MSQDDVSHIGEADAGAFVRLVAVQTSEWSEEGSRVVHIESATVVLHEQTSSCLLEFWGNWSMVIRAS